jgi:hypothetical protein
MPHFRGLSLYILMIVDCMSILVNVLAVSDAGINLCQPKKGLKYKEQHGKSNLQEIYWNA